METTAPEQEKGNPYLPQATPPLIMEVFQGINTSTTRPGVDDKQMWWCDGFMAIGPRFLRTLYGIGPSIHTETLTTIVWFDFANINATPYMLVIHSDGSIHAVNTNTGFESLIAPAGTLTSPSRISTGLSQYGSSYVLFVSSQANGYFIWDGTAFYSPGATVPGHGVVPTGISGTSVETYSGRVWISLGSAVNFTAPGSITNFSTGSGGGSFTSSDSFLRVAFSQLKQTNGFLYLIADSSINYISGVTTTGTPPTTTYTNQNADPEVGTPWAGTVDVFGRNIIFANAFGAHVSYGSAVTKISDDLDGVYNSVPNFGGMIPSAAKAIIFGKKVWILLLPIIDAYTGQQTNKLFIWNNKHWTTSSQDVPLIYIQHQEINSFITAYGTDGKSIYPLFTLPSANFKKVVQSRLWDQPLGYQMTKTTNRLFGLCQYYSLIAPTLTVSIDNENSSTGSTNTNTLNLGPVEATWTNNVGLMASWVNQYGSPVTWFVTGNSIVVFEPTAVGQQGSLLGITAATRSPDMALISIMIQPEVYSYRG